MITASVIARFATAAAPPREIRPGGRPRRPAFRRHLETKGTVAALLAVFILGLLLVGPRQVVRQPRAWIGAGVAVACRLPYVAWEIAHGWPSLTFVPTQDAVTAASTSRVTYIAQQIAFLGGTLALVAVGVIELWREPRLRVLALFGPALGLPQALSGHLSFQYWHPRRMPEHHLLTVGFDAGSLNLICREFHVVAQIANHWRNRQPGARPDHRDLHAEAATRAALVNTHHQRPALMMPNGQRNPPRSWRRSQATPAAGHCCY